MKVTTVPVQINVTGERLPSENGTVRNAMWSTKNGLLVFRVDSGTVTLEIIAEDAHCSFSAETTKKIYSLLKGVFK